MVKHTVSNTLSVFDQFVGLARKGLNSRGDFLSLIALLFPSFLNLVIIKCAVGERFVLVFWFVTFCMVFT